MNKHRKGLVIPAKAPEPSVSDQIAVKLDQPETPPSPTDEAKKALQADKQARQAEFMQLYQAASQKTRCHLLPRMTFVGTQLAADLVVSVGD